MTEVGALTHLPADVTALKSIQLQNFRSYRDLVLTSLPAKFIVLTGPNGTGKTNLLEAVSLLSPGKGLRGADMRDLQNMALPSPGWVVSAHVSTPYGDI